MTLSNHIILCCSLLLLTNPSQHQSLFFISFFLFFLALFIYLFLISWRLITLQYCRGFCHTLTWISLGYTFLMSQLFCILWPKYWSFSFSKSPSNENSGLISFRIDLFDPCCPRDSQESSPEPQFKSIDSLALSLLYGPTLTSIHDYWKNHSFWLTRTFVGKVMSLLFNMQVSRFIIAFLPRSKCPLISWLQSLSTVIL